MENNGTAFQWNRRAETSGISLINFQDFRSVSTTLLNPNKIFCLEKMGDNPVEFRKKQIQWYLDNHYFSELNRIDGQPMEFEWKIFQGFTTVAILN